jgi:uncharacterized protein
MKPVPRPKYGRGHGSLDGTMRSLAWRRIDEPGMEVAHVRSFTSAAGVQLGLTYDARWQLEGDELEVEVNAERRDRFSLEGADFFDVFASPFFNSLPVMRDGLLEAGPPREYAMRFIMVPELTAELSEQRYEPLGQRRVRYSSGSFESVIAFDEDGFVTIYDGFLERL